MNYASLPSIATNAPILVLGLGQTGVAVARWCAHHGAPLRIVDTRSNPPGLPTLQAELDGSRHSFHLGSSTLAPDLLNDVQLVVLSPGLSPLAEPVKSFLELAKQRNIEVVGEIELFARALNDYAAMGKTMQLLLITGTNGKTTVTTMVRQLLEGAKTTVCAAGNIGPSALEALLQAVQEQAMPDVWVLELSSFQLHTTQSLKAQAATVLNISQDHLDWHGSFEAYQQTKAKVFEMAEQAVINRDDAHVMAMVADPTATNVTSFGSDQPIYVGDLGLQQQDGIEWLCTSDAISDDATNTGRRRKTDKQRAKGRLVQLMPSDALQVRGRHNALNALAALALVRALGVSWAPALHALRQYHGEADRTEFVRTVAGIDFINDSKGTNVGATVAALQGLEQKAVLIAGGVGKGQDFTPLAQAAGKYARAVVLIGQDSASLSAALQKASSQGLTVKHAKTLDEAVATAFRLAQMGDAVLLSPACASHDMFADYRARGRAFIDAAQEIALENGEIA